MDNTFPVGIQTRKISDGLQKNVYYPCVVGMQNQPLQRFMNDTIAAEIEQLINEQVGNMPSEVVEMIGLYEIKNNQRQVLSLSLSNYTYHNQAAHGLTIIKSPTFDLEAGKLCKLEDLFTPGSDYVGRISLLIDEQIKARAIPLLGEFQQIRRDQDFYLADKAIVIYFQLYEITPYVFGFPMFPISVYDLQDIIDEAGPLGRLAVNN